MEGGQAREIPKAAESKRAPGLSDSPVYFLSLMRAKSTT